MPFWPYAGVPETVLPVTSARIVPPAVASARTALPVGVVNVLFWTVARTDAVPVVCWRLTPLPTPGGTVEVDDANALPVIVADDAAVPVASIRTPSSRLPATVRSESVV